MDMMSPPRNNFSDRDNDDIAQKDKEIKLLKD